MAFNYSPKIVTDGLVFAVDAANKKSYPGSGTTWSDLAGSNDGTLTNGPTFDSGNGGSIVFDGTDDSVPISLTSNTIFQSTFTVSTWFKQTDTDNTSFPRLFDKSANNNTVSGFTAFLYDSNSNGTDSVLYLKVTNVATLAYTSIDVNTWYNLTAVFKDYQYKVSINGGSLSTISHSQPLSAITTSNAFTIGNTSATGRPLAGNVAMTSIYNRELSQSEVTQNYNALKSRFGL